ncbi:hypothetical protein [Hoylesella marshii]|uniref:hypothetical protein n=1 Tax=Hoylesella marshii TaxID=189722 RepID=UPI0012B5E082|nr:hypothetical protein [Hoylesella marshii]
MSKNCHHPAQMTKKQQKNCHPPARMAENNQKTVIRHGGWQKITKKLSSATADGRK